MVRSTTTFPDTWILTSNAETRPQQLWHVYDISPQHIDLVEFEVLQDGELNLGGANTLELEEWEIRSRRLALNCHQRFGAVAVPGFVLMREHLDQSQVGQVCKFGDTARSNGASSLVCYGYTERVQAIGLLSDQTHKPRNRGRGSREIPRLTQIQLQIDAQIFTVTAAK